jgi:hypothetical protein
VIGFQVAKMVNNIHVISFSNSPFCSETLANLCGRQSATHAPVTSGRSQVRTFFEGKTVFITGVTGFIGKVILAKLLLAAPEVGKVVLLVRSGNGPAGKISPAQRLERDVFGSELFKTILKDKLHLKGKVTVRKKSIQALQR